mmetsp:Transcript_100010/g.283067  ORF Transcript_100010/g.283067 Transcript_100010/m.283067 type:complete len:658 (-) Transcript_100010:342-2315(-)
MASKPVPQLASLYVGDLSPLITEAHLHEIFSPIGAVASIRVCRNSVTRQSLGYAYVNFQNMSDADRALETLNYTKIEGRSCRILWSQRDPTERKTSPNNVYVKNLDPSIDNKALYDTFSLFGNVISCKVAADVNGTSYGYGFVDFETEEAANVAIERGNGMNIGDYTVHVCRVVKRSDRDKSDAENYTNLYIKSFPADWDEERLREMFTKLGPITSVALRSDSRGRPFAFVNYESAEDARTCVETLHMLDLRTDEEIEAAGEKAGEEELGPDDHPVNKLYVQRAQTKAERQEELTKARSPSAGDEGKGNGMPGCNLYLKNLDEDTDEAALRELFGKFGTIVSLATPQDDRGKSKGFGFLCYSTPDEATMAVTEMHLKVFKGKPLYVGLAERREVRQERLRMRYGGDGAGYGKGKKSAGKAYGEGADGGKGGYGKGDAGKGAYGSDAYGKGGYGKSAYGKGGGYGPQAYGPQDYKGGALSYNPNMQGMQRPSPMMVPMQPMQAMGWSNANMQQAAMMGWPRMAAMMGGNRPMMGGMMGKGKGYGMPGMGPHGAYGGMAQQGGWRQQHQQRYPREPPSGPPLTSADLNAASPMVQKQMLGERLFSAIARYQPDLVGKITGMMLEMDNNELLMLLESDQQLKKKVDEAVHVLQSAKQMPL